MRRLTLIFTLQLLLLSTPLYAHPGHDHNAAGAGLIHLLWLVPFIVAAVVVVFNEITAAKSGVNKTNRRG
jgi:hypothetical protein